MSNQPPLPPEIGNNQPSPSRQPDYVEIEIPVGDDSPIVIQQSRGNCLWGCGGMLGVSIVFIGLIIGVLYLGAQSVFNEFTGFMRFPSINLNGAPGEVFIPKNIYIPPVERVQALSELTTTRYNYAEVSTAQREIPQWLSLLYGDSVVMVLVGTIEAGIDISQITEEDIAYDEASEILTVTLPAPSLQTCFLDESQSYVVTRDTAIFSDTIDNLEVTLRRNALIHYRDIAVEEGILIDAETEARASLSELLEILVNDETVTINIAFDVPPLEPIIPGSCE